MNTAVEIVEVGLDRLEELIAWRMEVLSAVFADHHDADTPALRAANRAYYRQALAHSEHVAVFAQIGGTPVGCGGICFHREMPSPDNPSGNCAYLMNIYTRPHFRQRGVARKVVSHLIACAQRRKIDKIYLETSDLARPLYAALGFEPMSDYLKLHTEKHA